MEHHVGVCGQEDKMLSAGPALTGEPVFHIALACSCPAHRRLDRAMGRARLNHILAPEQIEAEFIRKQLRILLDERVESVRNLIGDILADVAK